MGLFFFESKCRGIFQRGILEKIMKILQNLQPKVIDPFPPGRSFIYFWHCHAYQRSTPLYTWLITAYKAYKMKQDSLHGLLGTTARACAVQGVLHHWACQCRNPSLRAQHKAAQQIPLVFQHPWTSRTREPAADPILMAEKLPSTSKTP